ncbi:MAG: hypothetical protein RR902_00550 [Oscillospiraceae bacterium]
MAAITQTPALSTIGRSLVWAVEATADTRPTTGYKQIHGIKEFPEMNPTPETIDTTTTDNTEYKTSIPGLKDLGGALAFKANLTESFILEWDEMYTAWKTGKAAGKAMHVAVVDVGLAKATYFTAEPSLLGLPGGGVAAVLETTGYLTPTGEPKLEVKPTVTP